jgi:hypothetical protein
MTNVDLSKTGNTATVDVKSSWLSKVNWTQAVGIGTSLLVVATGGKVNIPLDQQAEIIVAIQALQGLVTWALRTFAAPTITPSQAAKVK